MTLREFANVDSNLVDLSNGNKLEWREYMSRIVNGLGIDNVRPFLPCSIGHISEMFKKDVNLNNIPLKEWDFKAECIHGLLQRNRITCYSLSERVCILKEAARILCEMETRK